MPKRTVFVATDNPKAVEFITAYFSDTNSTPSIIRSKSDCASLFSSHPEFIFLQGDWVDERLQSKLKQLQTEKSNLKLFCLGNSSHDEIKWAGKIEFPLDEKIFRKAVLSHAQIPDPLKLLLVDDELDIMEMVKDYFDVRKDPAFSVRTAVNGLEGYKRIQEERPDCLILDIKMPVKTGVELYRDLVRSGQRIPTIIFIDSTAADDILEIRRWGAPVFVEKGGPSSSMPDMLALVKKLVAFF